MGIRRPGDRCKSTVTSGGQEGKGRLWNESCLREGKTKVIIKIEKDDNKL